MLRVTPHPVFVENVSARRGENDFAAPLSPFDAKAAWAAIRGKTIGSNRNFSLATHIQNDAAAQAGFAILRAGALPDPFDVRHCAVAERLIPRWQVAGDGDASLVRIVAEARGVSEMIAMKCESVALTIKHDLDRVIFDGDAPMSYEPSWDVVRAIVCRQDDVGYAKARDQLAHWREGRPVRARAFAAFVCPTETAWADADIDELLALVSSDPYALGFALPLLAVTNDEARTENLIRSVAVSYAYVLGSVARKWSFDIVAGFPPDSALRVLCTILDTLARDAAKTDLAKLGAAMCALEGEAMAEKLSTMLLHSPIGPLAVDYFRRFPALAQHALPKIAQGTSKAAEAARGLLAAAAPKDDVPLADASEVPALLRDAPWRKKKKTKQVVLDITSAPSEATITWAEGERERLIDNSLLYGNTTVDMPESELANWEALAAQYRPVDVWMNWTTRNRAWYRVPRAESLREWNENLGALVYLGPLRMLAQFESAAFPGLFSRDAFKTNSEQLLDAQLRAVGSESARIAASAFVRRKGWRKLARDWLVSHAAVAAKALVPDALGKQTRERKEAEHAVLAIARENREIVLGVAKALGADAERGIRELLDRDPLTDLDVKGKLPPFVQLETLPNVLTKSGKRLPLEAVEALLEILRSSPPDSPYAGLDAICEALDGASLGDFVWAIVQAWILAGAKRTFEWIPMSLALVGDDGCARRLAPYVRDWARKDANKADLVSDVLAAMGTSTALLHLSYVADKSRFEPSRAHAKEALEHVAALQGLSIEELADRTVPDLDLDPDGTATLDFGPRRFIVTFDEGLRPIIKDSSGSLVATLPRGTKADDAVKAKAAGVRFKGLKADADTVAQTLLRRFERAMLARRVWTAESWRRYLLGHPLVTHLTRRIVWESAGTGFRVAEDGSLADKNDAEYTLPTDAKVTLPHPLTLGTEAVTAWAHTLADYAIVQPFEQIGRATFVPRDDEKQVTTLARFEDRTSKAGPLIGFLDARGWVKYPDETSLSSCGKVLRTRTGGEASVLLTFGPGIEFANVAGSTDQTFIAPSLHGGPNWEAIDPIDFSELIRDLETIAH